MLSSSASARGLTALHYSIDGAHNRIRTDDLFLTKEVLYRLSYVSFASLRAPPAAIRPAKPHFSIGCATL